MINLRKKQNTQLLVLRSALKIVPKVFFELSLVLEMSNLEVHFFSSQNNNFQDTGCDDVIVSRLLGPAYSLSVTDTVIN